MNRMRLEQLKEILANVKPEDFNMDSWRTNSQTAARVDHCGTVCCAFGHACNNKNFQEEGLGWSDFWCPEYRVNGDLHLGYYAAELFFDLDADVSYDLFSPSMYSNTPKTTPAQVIQRIDAILKGEWK